MHGVLEPGVTEVVAVGVCAEVDENHSATRYELVGTMGEDLLVGCRSRHAHLPSGFGPIGPGPTVVTVG